MNYNSIENRSKQANKPLAMKFDKQSRRDDSMYQNQSVKNIQMEN